MSPQSTYHPKRALFLYALVTLFLVFEMAIQVSPSVMTASLSRDLHLTHFELGLMSGFYFYTYTIMQIPSGILYDRFNPRFILVGAISMCALGTLFFALASNIYVGCLARLLMGAGSAFAFVSVLVVIADLFDAKYFALLTGITQMLAALGAMSGQTLIGQLVDMTDWRITLYILAMAGGILAILILHCVRYQKKSSMYHEIQHNTLKNLYAVLAQPQTWWIGAYAFLMWAPMSGFASLWGVPYLEKTYLIPHTMAIALSSMMWLGIALASPILGWVSTHIGRRVLPLTFVAILGALSFGYLYAAPNVSGIRIGTMLFIAGAACSGQALSFSVVKENHPDHRRATAIAVNNMAVVISGGIIQPVIGVAFGSMVPLILLCYLLAAIITKFRVRETLDL